MQILIAEHSGFCEGVERAYQIALEQTEAGKPVFMLGNIVHNAQVVSKFTRAGARVIKNLSEIPPNSIGILIISAHGVPPEVYAEAKAKGLGMIDTTCPWVKKAQKIAKELAEEGRFIIIVGDKGHPEVKSLIGWSGGTAVVVEKVEEVAKLTLPAGQKIGILAQTTQAENTFNIIVAAVKQLEKNVKEHNTICGATAKRQAAAVNLAEEVDLMLVIGDPMSANTKRLTELCHQTGTETHQIQTVDELDKKWLAGKDKVGITAGASTPEWIIKEVIARLEKL